MVLEIGEFFTRSKSWANALQDENNRGWANNLLGIHFVFSNDIILSIRKYFTRNNKYITYDETSKYFMMLKKLLYFDFEKNKVNRLA